MKDKDIRLVLFLASFACGHFYSNISFPPSGSTLNMVAMALSGYTEEKETLWQQMCGTLCEQVCVHFTNLSKNPTRHHILLEVPSA